MMKQALALSLVAGVMGNSYGGYDDGYKAPSYDTYAPSYADNTYDYDTYKAPSYDTYKAPAYNGYDSYSKGYDSYSKGYDSYNTKGYDSYSKGYDSYNTKGYDSYNKGYDSYNKGYDSYNKGYDSYNKGYSTKGYSNSYNKGYDSYNKGYDSYNKGYDSYNKGYDSYNTKGYDSYNTKGYDSYNKGYGSYNNKGYVATYKSSSYKQPSYQFTGGAYGAVGNYGSNYNRYNRGHGSRYTQGYKSNYGSNYGSNYNQGYKSNYGSNYGSNYNKGYKAADYVDAGYDNYGNGGVSHYKGLSGPQQAKNAYGRYPGHGRYERIDKGYCATEGCFPVTSPEECSHAAAELYLVDTTVAEAKRLDNPAGCYFRPDFQTLWFNYYSSDAAQPNRQNLCYCPNDVGDVGYEPNAFNVGGESATIEEAAGEN